MYRLKLPTCTGVRIWHGDHDRTSSIVAARDLSERYGFSLTVISGASHGSHQSKSHDEALHLVRDHLTPGPAKPAT